MDYFSRKSLSKYLMNNIEFNKHDWLIFLGNYYHVGFKTGREAGLTLEGEVVALGKLTSISRWSKAKFK
jgi:hypothetical protein